MTRSLLAHSMFYEVLFPSVSLATAQREERLSLHKSIRFCPDPQMPLSQCPIVVFDLETTGLDADSDQMIEIGAQKYVDRKLVDQMSTLIYTDHPIPPTVQKITGLTNEMLQGQPLLEDVLHQFLRFIDGCLLVAHNAAFDTSFIAKACKTHGIELEWPVFCTLKMARDLLPDLERKNLDSLAEHYGLTFEARHRSIGDVKVTAAVLWELLANEGTDIQTWIDLQPYYISIT